MRAVCHFNGAKRRTGEVLIMLFYLVFITGKDYVENNFWRLLRQSSETE